MGTAQDCMVRHSLFCFVNKQSSLGWHCLTPCYDWLWCVVISMKNKFDEFVFNKKYTSQKKPCWKIRIRATKVTYFAQFTILFGKSKYQEFLSLCFNYQKKKWFHLLMCIKVIFFLSCMSFWIKEIAYFASNLIELYRRTFLMLRFRPLNYYFRTTTFVQNYHLTSNPHSNFRKFYVFKDCAGGFIINSISLKQQDHI